MKALFVILILVFVSLVNSATHYRHAWYLYDGYTDAQNGEGFDYHEFGFSWHTTDTHARTGYTYTDEGTTYDKEDEIRVTVKSNTATTPVEIGPDTTNPPLDYRQRVYKYFIPMIDGAHYKRRPYVAFINKLAKRSGEPVIYEVELYYFKCIGSMRDFLVNYNETEENVLVHDG